MRFHPTLRTLVLIMAAAFVAALAAGVLADSKRISLEPEEGLFKKPLKAFKSDACSGGKCIGTEDEIVDKGKECGGTVKIEFDVATSGNYVFWGRARWPDDCGDSFYIQIDDGEKRVFGEEGTPEQWRWRKLKGVKFNLSKGEHTLYIHGREDGALLDKVILQHESDGRIPQGKSG